MRTTAPFERAAGEATIMSLGFVRAARQLGSAGATNRVQPSCLIVEDQALIGLSLEAYLEEVGFGACTSVSSASEAIEWLSARTPSVVILDYALEDGPCTPLAQRLHRAGIPFLIYSGHQRTSAPVELQSVPWLTKPCDRPTILAALIRTVPQLAGRHEEVAATRN
jgi:DNA-binding NtrC family response regulator